MLVFWDFLRSVNICFKISVYWKGTDFCCWGSKISDMYIQVKPEVASKATCVFVSIREKATQSQVGIQKKCIGFGEAKSGLRKGNNDIEVEYCECQHTNGCQNSCRLPWCGSFDVKHVPECPERKQCDPDFLDDSFLSSEIDDPLDESLKAGDLETSDDKDESEEEDEEKISSSCMFIVFWEMLSQLLIFCFKCRKAVLIENTKVTGSLLAVTLKCVEGHHT